MDSWVVNPEESRMRLLEFIKSKVPASYSLRALKRGIENNLCTVNGRKERFASTLLGLGDKVCFEVERLTAEKKSAHIIEKKRILFEDAALIVYDKPSAIASEGPNSLAEQMKKYSPDAILAHRLDKDTTGVLLFAKSRDIFEYLCQQFRDHLVEKTYFAIVDGIPLEKSGEIENYLQPLHAYQGQTIWGCKEKEQRSSKGLYAYTKWIKEQGGHHAALLSCYPKTGRTHQLRVHLSHMGHPILGDYQYGRKFTCTFKAPRILLHASSLILAHPLDKKVMKITAALPEDFSQACHKLFER